MLGCQTRDPGGDEADLAPSVGRRDGSGGCGLSIDMSLHIIPRDLSATTGALNLGEIDAMLGGNASCDRRYPCAATVRGGGRSGGWLGRRRAGGL